MISTNSKTILNVGSLTNFNNLYSHLGPKLDSLRSKYFQHKDIDVEWDWTHIREKRIRLYVLVSVLSLANNLRKNVGHASRAVMFWDPYIVNFLNSIGFFDIVKAYDLFYWDPNIAGGYTPDKFDFNPHSTIINIPARLSDSETESFDEIDVDIWKETRRSEVEDDLMNELQPIFHPTKFRQEPSIQTRRAIASTTAELIVNSIFHGKDYPFIGVQRSTRGITVCVSDGGIGLLNGLKKHDWASDIGLNKHMDAIINSALMKDYEVGLYKAIDLVVNRGGYVILSSGNAEIKFTQSTWDVAQNRFNRKNFKSELQTAESILGPISYGYISPENWENGYHKEYEYNLIGTRVTFEL